MEDIHFHVTSFYKFADLHQRNLAEVCERLMQEGRSLGLCGLVLIAPEGCNATVSGSLAAIEKIKSYFKEMLSTTELDFKDSLCEKQPFSRFKIDIRKEIITFKGETSAESTKEIVAGLEHALSPSEWEKTLREEDVLLLDVRNWYETKLGKFKGALDPNLEVFSEFPEWLVHSEIPKEKKILMYCTGGVRCEKAYPEMTKLGFKNVYQLHGGILKYLEEFPNASYDGECFVFDHRVALDQQLKPTVNHHLCRHCGNPGQLKIACRRCGKDAQICEQCAKTESCQTCSKDCAWHYARVQSKEVGNLVPK